MTTCVRSRYGPRALGASSFSRDLASRASLLGEPFARARALALPHGFACGTAEALGPQSNKGCRHPDLSLHRMRPCAGLSARRPSATPLGLALGPDSPWEDDPCPGNLSQMVKGILTPYRYSRRHTHSRAVHRSLRCGFAPRGTLLYHPSVRSGPRIRYHA